MDSHPGTFHERSLGEILREIFVIYGRHFWKLIGLAAIVHAPINGLALVAGQNPVPVVILVLVGVLAVFVSYGATIVAVGLQHFYSDISIIGCYRSAWWRVVSLLMLGVVLGGGMLLSIVLTVVAMDSIARGAVLLALPFVAFSAALIGYLVFWSVAVQAVMFEGLKFTDGIRRSASLIQGQWQRVFGISMVVGLVVIGLFMVTTLVFLVVGGLIPDSEKDGFAAMGLSFLGGLVVSVVTAPVGFIATTLIYFDLRTRKEGYDLETLSSELGLQPTY